MKTLRKSDLDPDPIKQFSMWLEEAYKAGIIEPNAMALATSDEDGQPSIRMVLLKGFNREGFRFYTNYASDKGVQLENNPKCSLLFYWAKFERQVRIQANATKISFKESDKYFSSRPQENKLAAWASPQSQVIENRTHLETNYFFYKTKFNQNIPRPPHWGGYLLSPTYYEFWQGRKHRLHDRFAYRKSQDGSWLIQRLAP